MNSSEVLQKIDVLIESGNSVWENPGSKAKQDIAQFCNAVKALVHDIYGADHPYVKKYENENDDLQHDLGEGMSLLKSIRMEVEYSSNLGH